MGSIGNRSSVMTISQFKLESKKWESRELDNLSNALSFISSQFGDIQDLIGAIYRRSGSNWAGLYDRDGERGKGRATYFATGSFIREETMIHEFTHAVTEYIGAKYKQLGYDTRSDVMSAMRTEVHKELGEEERKYDGRKWSNRAEEYLSRQMEDFASGSTPDKYSKATLDVIKKWYNRAKKLPDKYVPKPQYHRIVI